MNHSIKFSQANKQIKPEEVAGENNRISLPYPSKKITKENYSKSTKIQSALDSNECLEEIVKSSSMYKFEGPQEYTHPDQLIRSAGKTERYSNTGNSYLH